MLIARRFCGPPESGNGGYTAGLLAAQLGGGANGAVEVTLRKPPPLERELDVRRTNDGVELYDGELLIAEARPTTLSVELPLPPSFEHAEQLSRHYIGHTLHHFPGCFVCGPARAVGDGLRIFPGAEHASHEVAAPWIPDESLAAPDGALRPEFLWAALDCVGYFAIGAPDYRVALLGRISAELSSVIHPGARCIVQGVPLAREGRKLHAATALYDHDGKPLARAQQTWISLS